MKHKLEESSFVIKPLTQEQKQHVLSLLQKHTDIRWCSGHKPQKYGYQKYYTDCDLCYGDDGQGLHFWAHVLGVDRFEHVFTYERFVPLIEPVTEENIDEHLERLDFLS